MILVRRAARFAGGSASVSEMLTSGFNRAFSHCSASPFFCLSKRRNQEKDPVLSAGFAGPLRCSRRRDAPINDFLGLTSLSRCSDTFARRRSAPDTRRRCASPSPQQRTEYSAGGLESKVGPKPSAFAERPGTTSPLSRRSCIFRPFRAGADVLVAWVSGAPHPRGQLFEHRQSDASSGRVPGNLCGCADPRSGRICRGSFVLVPFIWTSK